MNNYYLRVFELIKSQLDNDKYTATTSFQFGAS